MFFQPNAAVLMFVCSVLSVSVMFGILLCSLHCSEYFKQNDAGVWFTSQVTNTRSRLFSENHFEKLMRDDISYYYNSNTSVLEETSSQ